jgi:hypothetical protein
LELAIIESLKESETIESHKESEIIESHKESDIIEHKQPTESNPPKSEPAPIKRKKRGRPPNSEKREAEALLQKPPEVIKRENMMQRIMMMKEYLSEYKPSDQLWEQDDLALDSLSFAEMGPLILGALQRFEKSYL